MSVKQRRLLRIFVYVLLVTSAGATFLLGDRLWAAAKLGDLPVWAPLVAPGVFTLFVGLYAVDRWALVRRRNYPVARAILQVAFAALFLSLLWPQQTAQYREVMEAKQTEDYAVRLLKHREPNVRAAACEIIGWRGEVERYPQLQTLATTDPSARVKRVCSEALERLSATRARQEPGGPERAPERSP